MTSPAHELLLSLRDVGLCYRRRRGIFGEPFWALQSISFELLRGETLGIIGRNGAGKSTLMRLMAGIVKPDRGRFVNHGCHISLLALQLGFTPHLTGRENAILSAMLMGMTRQAVESRMDTIIEFAELEDFIDNPVATYSSGMNARLGFSVAFQSDPDVLLIDEVMGVGDEDFRKKSTQAMQEKIRSDKTVVLISHNPNTIRDLCDRAVWIEKGVSQAEGDTEEIVSTYLEFIKGGKRLSSAKQF